MEQRWSLKLKVILILAEIIPTMIFKNLKNFFFHTVMLTENNKYCLQEQNQAGLELWQKPQLRVNMM